MNYLKKIMLAGAFLGLTGAVFAAPTHLVTENNTHYGNVFAKIGAYKSNDPVAPQTTRNLPCTEVMLLCRLQKMPNQCTAEIIVQHKLSGAAESLGFVTMDIQTGELNSAQSHPSEHYSLSIGGNAKVVVNSTGNNF